MTVKLWKGAELRSKKRRHTVMAGLWIYTVRWPSGLVALVYWRSKLPLVVEVLVFVLLVFGTPDLRALFYSYSKYEEEWRRDNKRNGVQAEEPEAG
jgi:hypothetical protein